MALTSSDVSYGSGRTSSDPSSNPRVVVSNLPSSPRPHRAHSPDPARPTALTSSRTPPRASRSSASATTPTASNPKPRSLTCAEPHQSPPAAAELIVTGSTAAVTAAQTTPLYVVVLGRMRHDARTRAYVERRTREGLAKPEIIRRLKRYVAARSTTHSIWRRQHGSQNNYLPDHRSIDPLPGRAVITGGPAQSVFSITRLARLAGLHEARLMR